MGIRRKTVSEAKRGQIREMLAQGKRVKEIENKMGVSRSEVYKIRKQGEKAASRPEEQGLRRPEVVSEFPPTQPEKGISGLAIVISKRTEKHQHDLRQLILDWREVLRVPSPDEVLRELRGGTVRQLFSLYSQANGVRSLRYQWYMVVKVEEADGVPRVASVDWWPEGEKEHLRFREAFSPSRKSSHPLPEEFWIAYEKFNQELCEMFNRGAQLYHQLVERVKKATKLPLVEYPCHGLWPSFLNSAISEGRHRYLREKAGKKPSELNYDMPLELGTSGLYELGLGGWRLAGVNAKERKQEDSPADDPLAGVKQEREQAKQLHSELVSWLAECFGPIDGLYESACESLVKSRAALLKVAEVGWFDGQCKLCPTFSSAGAGAPETRATSIISEGISGPGRGVIHRAPGDSATDTA